MTKSWALVGTAVTIGWLLPWVALADSQAIDVSLTASWSAPHPVLEIAETAALDNEDIFFSLVSDLLSISPLTSTTTKHVYNEAMAHVSRHIDPASVQQLKLALSLHLATPRIEAHHHYYRQIQDPGCAVWAHVHDSLAPICDPNELAGQWDRATTIDLLPFDRVLRASPPAEKYIVLYTHDFSSKDFGTFHKLLIDAVDAHGISYVLRYKPDPDAVSKPLYLSGYGVELALKNTDYIVIDDRVNDEQPVKTATSFKERLANLGKVMEPLFEKSAKMEPLTPSEIEGLGTKAVALIKSAKDPLLALMHISQDFPRYAAMVSRTKDISEEAKEDLLAYRRLVPDGSNVLWCNGRQIDASKVNPFSLVHTIGQDRRMIKTLADLGMTYHQGLEFLTHTAFSTRDTTSGEETQNIIDIRSPAVLWWNDLEKDERYQGWSSNIFDLLRPVYPGHLRPIRRNMYSMVMFEDLTLASSLRRLTTEAHQMIEQGIPIRFGVVTLLSDDASMTAAKLLDYVASVYGEASAMDFLAEIHRAMTKQHLEKATESVLQDAFHSFQKSASKPANSDQVRSLRDILSSPSEHITNTQQLLKRVGVQQGQQVMSLNGKFFEHDDNKPWTQLVMELLNEQTQLIATSLFTGKLAPESDIFEYLMTQPYVQLSRNPYISVSKGQPLQMLPLHEATVPLMDPQYMLVPQGTLIHTTLWVVADVNSYQGANWFLQALDFAEEQAVQVALVHNTTSEHDRVTLSDMLYDAMVEQKADLPIIRQLVKESLNEIEASELPKDQVIVVAPGSPVVEQVVMQKAKLHWSTYLERMHKAGLVAPFAGFIMNGRVIGPLPSDVEFGKEEFALLYRYETEQRTGPVLEAISDVLGSQPALTDLVPRLIALMAADAESIPPSLFESQATPFRSRPYTALPDKYTGFTVTNKDKNVMIELGVVLDPLSETAQKWAAILDTLRALDWIRIKVYLNPVGSLPDMPIKRFYRYVFDPEWHFDAQTGEIEPPMAYFADTPTEPLYTLGMDTIHPWHVAVTRATVDLDNIRLDGRGASATYVLENILIEGHCIDSQTRQPPRGLQFNLGTLEQSSVTDTIVMANLGYFQLKSSPGVWTLKLREGRSGEVYAMTSVSTGGDWEYRDDEIEHASLALTSFEGLMVLPLVHKRPGMEEEDVLQGRSNADGSSGSVWSSMSKKLFGKSSSPSTHSVEQAEINIFSVASGHLYERFLSIMMATVMDHTNSTVKFWFIENFLSPSFKDTVPVLAEAYGFDYEMVTYKWPWWLRAQKEKQRTIWGYKILFLDVLFPLSLDKVIFVDADQIVRTDLKELVDMDLHGAPYGYTPFCDDREEMDQFRFWNQGYWKEHLQGRPYHISALYVVDLVQFRRMAAGDRLRAQYQQLSRDPHSLANLDQDLPNNMQHLVPIYSLPQEWLWCETWCSDESLKKAKTIDLCNNPLTKEPKLDRARRQIPEWEAYDQQIAAILSRDNSASAVTDTVHQAIPPSEHVKDEL